MSQEHFWVMLVCIIIIYHFSVTYLKNNPHCLNFSHCAEKILLEITHGTQE